ncbi:MAG: aspartate/glutamate racemase family protein [Candidatus Lokiarchaeota archaeon]|nr:aspartate/glutamate racemase family protein [Candidatus Harpocratesius repetitus]
MKTIGLLGGMSWESTAEYYRLLNEQIAKKLGGFHSARCIIYSVDFDLIVNLMHTDNWSEITDILTKIAKQIEKIGADCLLICTNTIHKIVPQMEQHLSIPIIHIVDATALKIQELGIKKVGLLGTKITMEDGFFSERLESKFNIKTIIPESSERKQINQIIFEELVRGIIRPESRRIFQKIINNMHENGAQGVILGCTEIPLLIGPSDVFIPIFDTTRLHVEYAIDLIINQSA